MKNTSKKYPLLVSLIVSCVLVVASIFVVAFCGLKLSPSLGGGSQFEISISDTTDAKTCAQSIKKVLANNGLSYDSFTVEDKVKAGNTATEHSQRYIVVNVGSSDISDEKEAKVKAELAEKLKVDLDDISDINNIVSSIKSKDILLFGLGIGIIAVCLFLFGFIRYDVFAGLAFLVAILHNIILFLSVMILTRIPLGLVSIASIAILSLIMSAVLVSIFEKNKAETELKTKEKETPSERLLRSEKVAIKPYIIVVGAVALFSLMLLFAPINNVIWSLLSILISLAVSVYSTLLIGPSVYATFLDIRENRFNATLSRNDNVNKVIKKKKARAKKDSK